MVSPLVGIDYPFITLVNHILEKRGSHLHLNLLSFTFFRFVFLLYCEFLTIQYPANKQALNYKYDSPIQA